MKIEIDGKPLDNNSPRFCPKCEVSLLGEPIPEDKRKQYSGTHWKREIGIDGGYLGIYDGIVAYQCPDCKETWPRGLSTWAIEMFDKYQKVCNGKKIEEFDPFKT